MRKFWHWFFFLEKKLGSVRDSVEEVAEGADLFEVDRGVVVEIVGSEDS